jgi:hypothetical protein
MAFKRPKIDSRQFSRIPNRKERKSWGDGKVYKKRKPCLRCKRMFDYISAKELYCGYCRKKI